VKVVGYRSGFHRFRVAVSLDRFTNIARPLKVCQPLWAKFVFTNEGKAFSLSIVDCGSIRLIYFLILWFLKSANKYLQALRGKTLEIFRI
jgi:hypothetical protein